MDPKHGARRRTPRIDTLIARARLVDARGRAGAGTTMPAPLLAQLRQPSAGACTPSRWAGPLLTLLLIAALGGLLYVRAPDAADTTYPLVWGVLSCLASGLIGAVTGLLVGQGQALGLWLAKWLTVLCAAGCAAQLAAAAFDVTQPSVGPLIVGALAATANWCLMGSEAFSGFVTYRVLLRQARHASR